MVAGCTGQAIPWTPNTGGTNIEPADVIVASNEPVIPSEPSADTIFTARFMVKNQHENNKANNVGVWIYDTGKCTLNKVNSLTAEKVGGFWAGLMIETSAGTEHITDFAPGQQESVRMDLKSPSSSETVNLAYSCPIRYMINYSFEAKSSVTTDVMALDRLKQIETQTGERPVYTRTLNVGAGPIRIMLEPISSMPIEAGKTLRFEITLKNEGTGEYPSVMPDQLTLKVPKDFEPVLDDNNRACGGFFWGGTPDGETIIKYTNGRKIDLIEKQANPITCEFTTKTDVNIEKEYVITANLPYSYGYFGQEITVPIKK